MARAALSHLPGAGKPEQIASVLENEISARASSALAKDCRAKTSWVSAFPSVATRYAKDWRNFPAAA